MAGQSVGDGDDANQHAEGRQEIIVKVDNIEINDRTEEVINKLRKINSLIESQRKLTR